MRTIILDTESNGMRPEQICQLSYIIAENGQLTGRNFFFSVEHMNEFAQKKHGYSKMRLYELSGGRDFVERFEEFRGDFGGVDLICGHNISADVRLLKLSFRDAGALYPKIKELCTMRHFDNAMHLKDKRGKHKYPRLDELCRYYNIDDKAVRRLCTKVFGKTSYRAHDARFDTVATLLCIQEGQNRGDIRGVI